MKEKSSMAEKVTSKNGSTKATRVTKCSTDTFRSTPNSIVTIDFGTTHCSLSYLTGIQACLNPSAEDPVLLKLDTEGRKRVPSCILFDQLGNRKSFGYQARDQYVKLTKEEKTLSPFFTHIKKEIQRKENVGRNQKILAMNEKQYFLIDVIAHILCYLKERILEELKHFGYFKSTPKVTDIDWVITVPAIWKASGKRMMREAGYMAGLCDPDVKIENLREFAKGEERRSREESNPEKLSLALEPESAAIECKKAVLKDKKNTKDVKYYLIVDCGGGTVDIATHGIVGGHVQELVPSAGNMSGGTTINERFQKFLGDFVGDPDFFQYLNAPNADKSKRISEINTIVYTKFEDQKICFGNQESEDFVVEFPFAFAHHFGGLMENKATTPGVRIEDDGSRMRLSYKKMAEFFKPTINEIGKLICHHIKENGLASTIDTIFGVGGFGGCRYLRAQLELAINSEFRKNKIQHFCPPEPQLAVVKGALAFRCDPNVIQRRKADATYGIGCRIPFNEDKHRLDYREDDADKSSTKWCKNIFSTFIERGESICTNEVFVCNYSPASRSQKTIELTFYSAPHTDVGYTTDPDVTELAKMNVSIAGSGRDREIEVVFDVTHTEIQVCARDKQSKNEYKIIIDFLSAKNN